MLEYGGQIGAEAPALAAPPAERAPDNSPVSQLLRLAIAHRLFLALLMLVGAVIGVVKTAAALRRSCANLSRSARYARRRARPANALDSTGYINLVESQARIVASQLVLDRVVAAEALDKYGIRAAGFLAARIVVRHEGNTG